MKCRVGNERNCSLSCRISPLWPMPSPTLEFGCYNVFTTICSKDQTKESEIGMWNLFTFTVSDLFITRKRWCCYHLPLFHLLSVLNDQSTFFSVKWFRLHLISNYSPWTGGFAVVQLSKVGLPFRGREGQLTNWSEKEFLSFALFTKVCSPSSHATASTCGTQLLLAFDDRNCDL